MLLLQSQVFHCKRPHSVLLFFCKILCNNILVSIYMYTNWPHGQIGKIFSELHVSSFAEPVSTFLFLADRSGTQYENPSSQ